MQVILDSSFARPGSAPLWGGKKVEFRDWTRSLSIQQDGFLVLFFVSNVFGLDLVVLLELELVSVF